MKFLIQEFCPSSKPDQVRYYLRLEKDGIFQGWAVPKGVPDYVGVKYLAIRVGDYRLDRANFEGEVASEVYGPGRISIWDRGVYQPIKGRDREIRFRLNGKKARGTYSLVEFEQSGKNHWLISQEKPAETSPPNHHRPQKLARRSPRPPRSRRRHTPARPRKQTPTSPGKKSTSRQGSRKRSRGFTTTSSIVRRLLGM